MAATVAPERILKELADLWISLGKQGQAEGGAGVLRSCTMTLVVLAEESEDAVGIGETLAALMPEHPARTIMVRLRGSGERTMAERVYAQCWMPFGQRRQICCEQIEIIASDAALVDLPSVVLPLVVPDLPVIVWCRSPRLARMPEFGAVASMAYKVVVDTGGLAEGPAALRRLANLARGTLLADLAWTRLTRWREMLSQVFENRLYLAKLPQISEVRVEFSADHETAAWYMGTWIADALAYARVSPALTVLPGAPGCPSLSVELSGGDFRVELTRSDQRLSVKVNGFSSYTSLSEPTDYFLMREELSIVRPDPVFARALASAARQAYPIDK